MQSESTNSLFFRVPDEVTREDALEWLTGRTVELVSRPETLLGVGEYELRSLEASWLELVCAPSPSPVSAGMLGPWLGIAESIAQNWGSQVIGLSFREGTLSLVAANGRPVPGLGSGTLRRVAAWLSRLPRGPRRCLREVGGRHVAARRAEPHVIGGCLAYLRLALLARVERLGLLVSADVEAGSRPSFFMPHLVTPAQAPCSA